MNEMIERVAIALWALETETDCHDWNELAQFKKDETYEKAKAAIKAMREPNKDMVIAGNRCCESNENVEGIWEAMIDTSLGKSPYAW